MNRLAGSDFYLTASEQEQLELRQLAGLVQLLEQLVHCPRELEAMAAVARPLLPDLELIDALAALLVWVW
jgi:hypothetical protein